MSRATTTFGDVLRQLRLAAGLSQEALAERAGVSVRGISDLERGARRTPHLTTVRMLADALELGPADRQALLAAARPARVTESEDLASSQYAPLPVPLTALLGRERELASLVSLLGNGDTRLVTLTGPGGTGKTRLALEVGAHLQGEFADGVVFVDLAPLVDASLVPPTIARALGVRERAGQSLLATLSQFLASKHLLLLLDNCDQVLKAAPQIAALLAAGPQLSVLATSREPLHMRGEHLFPLLPLSVPPADQLPAIDELVRIPAIALFLERAAASQPNFTLTTDNAAAIAAICRRLEGLPLAIELAAARSNFLPPAALLTRLEKRLPLLTSGSRDLPARQRTMRDAIAWSYDQLAPDEQTLFRRLGVFAGGWTLEAAVAATHVAGNLDVVDGLASLVDKSLVQRHDTNLEPRFAMLETVREFALDHLGEEVDQGRATERAHAGYFLSLAEQAYAGLVGAQQQTWLARLDAEEANIRVALEWSLTQGSPEAAVRFARALWRYWLARGRLIEGRSWLERALTLPELAEVPVSVRADAHNALGNLLGDGAEYTLARQHYAEALTLRRRLADSDGIAGALNNLGIVAAWLGDYDGALALHKESLALREAQHDAFGMALSLTNMGDILLAQGDFNGAQDYQDEALRLRELVHDAAGVAYSTYNLGEIARLRGDTPEATRFLKDSLCRFEALGDQFGIAYTECSLGDLASQEGETRRAAQRLERALRTRTEMGDKRGVIECLEALAMAALRSGADHDGIRLLSAAWTERKKLSCPVPPSTLSEHEQALARGRSRLGAATVDALQQEGRQLTPEQAHMLADEILDHLAPEEEGVAEAENEGPAKAGL